MGKKKGRGGQKGSKMGAGIGRKREKGEKKAVRKKSEKSEIFKTPDAKSQSQNGRFFGTPG